MFARVFDTAKRVLSRSPSYQREPEEANDNIPRSAQADADAEDMVTTRRGTGTGPSVESTPASSVRKTTRGKRHLEVEEVQETPTGSKRRRKAAPKGEAAVEQDGDKAQDSVETPVAGEKNSDFYTPATAIPHRTKGQIGEPSSTPVARRNSPKVLISSSVPQESDPASTQDDVFYTPAQQSFATTVDRDQRDGSLTPKANTKAAKATPASGKGSGKRGRPKKSTEASSPEKTPVTSNLPDEIPSSTWDSEQTPLSPVQQDEDSEASHLVAGDLNSGPAAPEGDEIPGDQQGTDSDAAQEDDTSPPNTKNQAAQDKAQDLASLGIAYEDVAPSREIVPHPRHHRFGSEEPAGIADTTVQAEPEEEVGQHGDDGASDSDEAPEIVTTSAAASKAKAATEETWRARLAQQAKEEKRRQQRADRIAEEQAEKRKREEKKAQKLARQEAKLARQQQHEVSSPPRAPMDVDMHELPDLLPDSILEAAGDRRPPTPPPFRAGKTVKELRKEKLNRHIKFLEQGEKPIKDLKKGKVNVAVLAQRNMLLAPKVNRDTKNIREHWLKGREAVRKGRGERKGTSFKKMERRPVGGGFLRGGDDD